MVCRRNLNRKVPPFGLKISAQHAKKSRDLYAVMLCSAHPYKLEDVGIATFFFYEPFINQQLHCIEYTQCKRIQLPWFFVSQSSKAFAVRDIREFTACLTSPNESGPAA